MAWPTPDSLDFAATALSHAGGDGSAEGAGKHLIVVTYTYWNGVAGEPAESGFIGAFSSHHKAREAIHEKTKDQPTCYTVRITECELDKLYDGPWPCGEFDM